MEIYFKNRGKEMKGFRKPTKSEIISKQKDVINDLLKIAEKQRDLIDDMGMELERVINDRTARDNPDK